jgi:hypothetical protein
MSWRTLALALVALSASACTGAGSATTRPIDGAVIDGAVLQVWFQACNAEHIEVRFANFANDSFSIEVLSTHSGDDCDNGFVAVTLPRSVTTPVAIFDNNGQSVPQRPGN